MFLFNMKDFPSYKNFVDLLKNKYLAKDIIIEKHHIIPKSLGGLDDENNIIPIMVIDHVKAHFILWKDSLLLQNKFVEIKTFYPLKWMFHLHSIQYKHLQKSEIKELEPIFEEYKKNKEYLSNLISTINKGNRVAKNRKWMNKDKINKMVLPENIDYYLQNNWNFGIYHSPETKKITASKISAIHKNKTVSQLTKNKLTLNRTDRVWITKNNQTKAVKINDFEKYKLKGWNKGRILPPIVKKLCKICNKLYDPGNYAKHIKHSLCYQLKSNHEEKVA